MSTALNNQLLKFTAQRDIALTPPIWLAIGVLSYNHALLAKAPLRILAPAEVADDLQEQDRQALEAGTAAIADASTLSPTSLSATIRIARTLLEPLNISVCLLGTHQKKYLFVVARDAASKNPELPDAHTPRILPVHDYPSTAPKSLP